MATRTLASWSVSLTITTLPQPVRHAALRSLYNYIGCTIGGSTHPTVTKAQQALLPFFGPPTSTLLGSSIANSSNSPDPDALNAALLNGIASHVHDYDDTHLQTIIHPTGPIASAALALAQHRSTKSPVSGDDLLLALVAGIEASCKLGLAVWPTHYDIGWHITSTTGAIGAAVACCKLLSLDATRTAHAIGLASVHVIGLREMFGSDTKSFHPGAAAQAGLRAALLAEAGFTSSECALEAKRGWANVVVGGGTPKLDEFLAELGREGRWEVERNAFKPFPCGIVCHPAIDACIQLSREMGAKGLGVDDIQSVNARVHPLVIELTAKRTPRDGLEGKFSVFYGCAVGLIFGKAGPAEYADEVVTDPKVVAVRDKVDAQEDGSLGSDETVVEVTLKDGGMLVKHVEHAVGSLDVPMTDKQLEDKFLDQVALVLGNERAQEVSKVCWGIGDADNVANVVRSL